MVPRISESANRRNAPRPASREGSGNVKCRQKKVYGDERGSLFHPDRHQLEGARSWLVRVLARRAVDILKALETGP